MRHVISRKVAVVGGAGFLGSHLVEHLINDRNCEVMVLDNLCAGRFVHPKARFEHVDITYSEEYMRRLFNEVDFVFNYAAHPYVPLSFARPLHVFETNATGAMRVINAARDAGVEAILQVSSAELYGGRINHEGVGEGNIEDERLSELSPVFPHSTYGAAKAAVDYYVQARWREQGTPCIALRQFNCVGERETHPYVIPEIIGQLTEVFEEYGQHPPEPPVVRLGNNSFRDFLYAGDAVRLAVELLERGEFGEVYNLGSESGIKIYDLARLIGEVMGFAEVKVEEDPQRKRPWEIWHLLSDNTKLWQAIGGCPGPGLTPLRTAIERTIAWYEQVGRVWPWGN